jgi:hypothetical protein
MRRNREQDQDSKIATKFRKGAWGSALMHMSALRELEVEFETIKWRESELQTTLDQAKDIKFPLTKTMILSASECEVQKITWRGPQLFWPDECPVCTRFWPVMTVMRTIS